MDGSAEGELDDPVFGDIVHSKGGGCGNVCLSCNDVLNITPFDIQYCHSSVLFLVPGNMSRHTQYIPAEKLKPRIPILKL
ncbi:hypothetical protein MTR67_005508 [Solanum verrucosum]|uniref:Uncharacterized protein n=1 Tax=Solanum verrucosum TaxID=315347 RepID=A0AAF0PWI7_SOLVR|nr:hypothetical protein MTR67_005508 [Solanum verrucosum]